MPSCDERSVHWWLLLNRANEYSGVPSHVKKTDKQGEALYTFVYDIVALAEYMLMLNLLHGSNLFVFSDKAGSHLVLTRRC